MLFQEHQDELLVLLVLVAITSYPYGTRHNLHMDRNIPFQPHYTRTDMRADMRSCHMGLEGDSEGVRVDRVDAPRRSSASVVL